MSRGLRIEDADRMELGAWVDMIVEYNNMTCPEEYKLHYATQSDFDAF